MLDLYQKLEKIEAENQKLRSDNGVLQKDNEKLI
jgi:hypothetical protein